MISTMIQIVIEFYRWTSISPKYKKIEKKSSEMYSNDIELEFCIHCAAWLVSHVCELQRKYSVIL